MKGYFVLEDFDKKELESPENSDDAADGQLGSNDAGSAVVGAIESKVLDEENGAVTLNRELFSATEPCTEAAASEGAEPDKLKRLWVRVGCAALLLVFAFTGAFFGVAYMCRTSVFGDSDFFAAFIAKWAGVTENRVEVDYVSGEYRGDAIELAEKTMSTTVLVHIGYRKENGGFVQTNSGSGVIYARIQNSDKYYIVTNYHVIENAPGVLVEIRDEGAENESDNRFDATVKYSDQMSDIAVLMIECDKELSVATQADSSKAKAGQSIIIAGNPLGHGFAVSLGYISNPYRVTTANNNVPLMTVDASVNPGNSGGGVYDSAGNLLGIVVSKASGTDIDGIGYAIPVNTINEVVNDLLTWGYVKGRPALGITVRGLFNATTFYMAMEGELNGYIFDDSSLRYGVYIIESKNPLLQKGDRIVQVDGTPVSASADISSALLDKKPGNAISVTVERATKPDPEGAVVYTQYTFDVLLIERDFPDELPG